MCLHTSNAHKHFPSFRAVTDSINQLITLCTQQAPGQKECDNALRELEVNRTYQTGKIKSQILFTMGYLCSPKRNNIFMLPGVPESLWICLTREILLIVNNFGNAVLRLTLLTHLPGCQRNAGQSQRASQWPLLLRLHRECDGELQGRPSNQL